GALPAPADVLVGERLQLALTATRTGPQTLVIDDLHATAALASLRGSGRLDGEADRVVAKAALQIDDLAPLGRALEAPLAGSLQLDADVDGPLMRPEGRLRLAATDLAAAEVAVAELQTTLDLAMLDR